MYVKSMDGAQDNRCRIRMDFGSTSVLHVLADGFSPITLFILKITAVISIMYENQPVSYKIKSKHVYF